jgi:predicted membrane chloride channel (bestrophin family)
MAPLTKREWFFLIAIAVGLILGKLLKRVTVGLALGLLLTFMAVMIVSNKKK